MSDTLQQHKILFLLPFAPRLDATHGGSRVMAEFIAAASERHKVALLYLRAEAEPPLDPLLVERCTLVEEVRRLARPHQGPHWLRVARTVGAQLGGRPLWSLDWFVPAYQERVRVLAASWQPNIVQLEYHIMGQYLPALAACPARCIVVEHEPGTAAAWEAWRARQRPGRLTEILDLWAWWRFERAILQKVDAVVAFTPQDQITLQRLTQRTPVYCIPLGMKLPAQPLNPIGDNPPTLLFVGNFMHPPNVEAAERLIERIFPLVRARFPASQLYIVGANPPPLLQRHRDRVIVTGHVPSVEPYLNQAAIVLAPLRIGGGMRVKVLEALAAGKAVVASLLAAAGLAVVDGEHLLFAESDDQFAEAICNLLNDPRYRQTLATNAREWAKAHLGWDQTVASYEKLYHELLELKATVPEVFLVDNSGSDTAIQYPVSLIICSRNRPNMLIETIGSVLQGNDVPAELIIVDQSDVPHPILAEQSNNSRSRIRYIWSQTVGLSRANNIGIASARYDWIAFTHDDVFVTRDWFGSMIQQLLAAGEGTVVTGRVLPSAPEVPGGFAPTLKVDEQPAVYEGRVGIDVLKPLNMAMHRSALMKVSGFDVRLGPGTIFPGAEDSDLGFRLLEAGYRIVYVPEATIYHRAWRNEQDYLPLRWNYGVAQGAFFAKHLRRDDLYMLKRLIQDTRRRARRFPRRLWRERSRAFGDPLFLWGNFVGAIRWLLQAHRTDAPWEPVLQSPEARQ